MYITDERIHEIIANNCGNPPTRKLVEYHIWVNQMKLEFYTKSPQLWLTKEEQAQSLDTYRRAVVAGKELLKQL